MTNIKWGLIQPLIGGAGLGTYQIFKTKPEFIKAYDFSGGNDEHLKNYWSDVDYQIINDDDDHTNDNIDVVVGVPVCSALSSLNAKSDANYESINNVYDISIYALQKIKPKVAIFENAPGLFTKKGKLVRDRLYEIARENEYSLTIYKTCTSLHGIPQQRLRTFFIFWKDTKCPIMNWYDEQCKSCEDYLNELSSDLKHYDEFSNKTNLEDDIHFKYIVNELGKDFRNKLKDFGYKTILTYCRKENKIGDLLEFAKSNNADEKVIKRITHIKHKIDSGLNFWDNSPHIIFDKTNAIQGRVFQHTIHPVENRYLNVREYMHLMGLPNDFNLSSTKYEHVCQNVPVCTMASMAKEIKKYLNNTLTISKHTLLLQDNIKKQTNSSESIDNNSLAYLFE